MRGSQVTRGAQNRDPPREEDGHTLGMRQDGSDLPRIRPPHHSLLGADARKAGDPCPGLPPPPSSRARLGGGSSTGYSQPPLKARLRRSNRPRVLRRGASGVAAARRPRRRGCIPVSLLEPVGEFRRARGNRCPYRSDVTRIDEWPAPASLSSCVFHDLRHTCAALLIHPGCPGCRHRAPRRPAAWSWTAAPGRVQPGAIDLGAAHSPVAAFVGAAPTTVQSWPKRVNQLCWKD
jgi:hypothetical protein